MKTRNAGVATGGWDSADWVVEIGRTGGAEEDIVGGFEEKRER